MKVLIATKNKGKIEGAKRSFEKFFEDVEVVENKTGLQSVSSSPGFPVPERLVEKIKEIGLGDLMNHIFDEEDLHSRGVGIQLLTNGVVSRIDLTELAFEMALTKFINDEKWK